MRQSIRVLFFGPLLTLLAGHALSDNINPAARPAAASARQAIANDSFSALDRNQDGRLSRSEAGFDSRLSQTFALIDTDGDGFVTPEEFSTAQSKAATLDKPAR